MKFARTILITTLLVLAFALIFPSQESVKAADKNDSITKLMTYQKPLDISLGNGGVFFPSSTYTGQAVLNRIIPIHTKQLTFSQRWVDIHLYDSTGKEFKKVYGYVYVYFNLNVDDWAAWKKGNLGIYHYNETKKIWEECETYFIENSNTPHGRVRFMVTQEFGLYGLAIKR